MKTLIAIPAYNCAPQLVRVLDEIDDELVSRIDAVWVVDNRSTDETAERAVEYASGGRIPQLCVFRKEVNNNLGGTHKSVFEHARSEGFTHVVILHGDNQAVSSEASLLLDAVVNGGPQTVLGSRFNRRSRLFGYDWKRIWGNRVLNTLYSVLTFRRCEDLGSGLNLFAIDDLDRRSYLGFANSLTFNFELLLDLVRRKVRFQYVPITWREEDQVSNARNWNIFFTGIKVVLRWRFTRAAERPVDAEQYGWERIA